MYDPADTLAIEPGGHEDVLTSTRVSPRRTADRVPAWLAGAAGRPETERRVRDRDQGGRAEVRRQDREIGVWQHDIASATTTWNPGLYALLGCQGKKLEPSVETFLERIHRDDFERAERSILETLRSGLPCAYEARLERADGTFVRVAARSLLLRDATGSPRALIGTLEDMAGRVSPAALRLSEDRIYSLLDGMKSALFTANEHGSLTYINPAVSGIFGYSREELFGKHLSVLFPGFALSGADAPVRGRLLELVGQRRNEDLFPVELWLFDLPNPESRHFAGCLRDLTTQAAGEIEI